MTWRTSAQYLEPGDVFPPDGNLDVADLGLDGHRVVAVAVPLAAGLEVRVGLAHRHGDDICVATLNRDQRLEVLRVDGPHYAGLPPVLVGHAEVEVDGFAWQEADVYGALARHLGRWIVTYEIDDHEACGRVSWHVKATVRYVASADETVLLASLGVVPYGPPTPEWPL